jgi:hypothetical protein
MKRFQVVLSIAAAVAAVFAILSIQTVTARGQAETADRIITAVFHYEEAARHGTAAEKAIAYQALMATLKRSDGQ